MKLAKIIIGVLVLILLSAYYFNKQNPVYVHNLYQKFESKLKSSIAKFMPKQAVTYHCPSPAVVFQNKEKVGSWQNGSLSWAISFKGWKVTGSSIAFMQAILNKKSNNIVCYYQWPNSKKPGTDLWLTVNWQPSSAKAQPQTTGVHWHETGGTLLCNSSYKACGFNVLN